MNKRNTALWVFLIVSGLGLLPLAAQASDLEAGKQFYENKKCGMCHVFGGKGGKMGPDLSKNNKNRDREWLTQFLKDPKKMIPGAKMMAVKGTDAEISALVSYLLSEQ